MGCSRAEMVNFSAAMNMPTPALGNVFDDNVKVIDTVMTQVRRFGSSIEINKQTITLCADIRRIRTTHGLKTYKKKATFSSTADDPVDATTTSNASRNEPNDAIVSFDGLPLRSPVCHLERYWMCCRFSPEVENKNIRSENYKMWFESHVSFCNKNFIGSSPATEATSDVELWGRIFG